MSLRCYICPLIRLRPPNSTRLSLKLFTTEPLRPPLRLRRNARPKFWKPAEIADPAEREKEEAAIGLIEQERGLTEFPGAYSSFVGSPASEGLLQFDLWEESPKNKSKWSKSKRTSPNTVCGTVCLLRRCPQQHLSNAGNNECFEPFTSNIYTRRTLAGEFIVINKHLIKDLIDLDMWNTYETEPYQGKRLGAEYREDPHSS